MRALSKLLGREQTTIAKVQAPSANLIKSDNEFIVPEPEEIQVEMEPEKLDGYAQKTDKCGFAKEVVAREKLLHLLKNKNFRIYDRKKMDGFMKLYIQYAFKNLQLGDDLWWTWVELKSYRHPLPSRVVDNIKTLYFSGETNEYSPPENFIFFVSDIILVTSRNDYNKKNTGNWILQSEVIPMKRNTEICFLRVAPDADTLVAESLIIDAWRGPTFSDEEACLP